MREENPEAEKTDSGDGGNRPPARRFWMSKRVLACAAAVLVAAIAAAALWNFWRNRGYSRDPSTLVPADVPFFLETRDFGQLVRAGAMWPVWTGSIRSEGEEQWSVLEANLAGFVSELYPGISVKFPLTWLAEAGRAALAGGEGSGWILLVEIPDPEDSIARLEAEAKTAARRVSGDNRGGKILAVDGREGTLFLQALGRWLALSSSETLLGFAARSVSVREFNLSRASVLPPWGRGIAVRGVVDPKFFAGRLFAGEPSLGRMAGWLETSARFSLTASVGSDGLLETRLENSFMGRGVATDSAWGTVKSAIWALLLVLAAAIVVLVLVVSGFAGWFKTLAWWKKARPAASPEKAAPSPAFMEDAGMAPGKDAAPGEARPVAEKRSETKIISVDAALETNPEEGDGGEEAEAGDSGENRDDGGEERKTGKTITASDSVRIFVEAADRPAGGEAAPEGESVGTGEEDGTPEKDEPGEQART